MDVSAAPHLLPPIAPFESTSEAGTSYDSSNSSNSNLQQKSGTRPNWSLWPLKTSSGILKNRGGYISSSNSRVSSQSRDGNNYPTSNSPSPPSPFGPGHRSDSSPPTTPPDYALADLYSSRIRSSTFSLDAPPKSSGSASRQGLSPYPSSVNPSSPSSRNDIFSSPVASPVPAPAPRLPSGNLQRPGITPSTSRNASFFDSPTSQAASSPQNILSIGGHRRIASVESTSDRPNYGRSNTEEREQERARIRQSNAEVDFRLCPIKDYLLGEGRHCTVYLGAYRTKGADSSDRDGKVFPHWTLCAIKRLHSDRQSQLLGLEEAFALRRLGPHPNVIKLINIRDEVELTTTSPIRTNGENNWSGVAVPVSLQGQQKVELQANHIGQGLPSNLSATAHGRSSSEAQADPIPSFTEKNLPHLHAHRRLASTPAKGPTLVVASPDGDNLCDSPIAPESTLPESLVSEKENSNSDLPRLLMLLELLPYSLSTFARKSPDRIDYVQWKQWALELAGVVEWLHAKGCVHADLKPENVLLTSDLKVKLCDFNSALFPNPSTPLTDGLGLGTPAYGAPELASSKGFSYPVDVWSLGAILYTLAVGVDSFRTARSMIDILHRKRVFFESEENDRIASLSVAEGRASSNNGGSANASRNGSLRGKKIGESEYTSGTSRPTATLHRENSSESVSSIASSVMLSGSSGRNPSIRAISMLLEPSPPIGILAPPGSQSSSSLQKYKFGKPSSSKNSKNESSASVSLGGTGGHGHHRATSLGKAQTNSLLSPNAARRPNQVSRPTELRRTTSYGGIESSESTGDEASITPEPVVEHQIGATKRDSAGLRLAVTAAFAQSSRVVQQQQHHQHQHQHQQGARENSSGSEEDYHNQVNRSYEEEARPYKDGSPALILPGGGRLPDEARNLLEKMLYANPHNRPTAAQVRQQLEAL